MADPKAIAAIEGMIADLRARGDERMGHLWRTYTVAAQVLKAFLGIEWLEKHVLGQTAPTEFFRNDWSTDARRNVHMLRVIHLAEMMLNLRPVPGFSHVKQRLKEAQDIESVFAELEVGKLLIIYGVPFRFVVPLKLRGRDYDVELKVGDHAVCADVKHRLETTVEGEETLLRLLRRAATKQLPRDKPGAFFVSLPQSWNEDGRQDRHIQTFESITCRLWGSTQRVVSVVFYFSLALDFSGRTAPITVISEFTSPNHRFDKNVDWTIIKDPRRSIAELGAATLPDTWLDLIKMSA